MSPDDAHKAKVARLEGLLASKERLLVKSESKRKVHAARAAELEAQLADRDAIIAEAEKILLGGIGQSWSRVVDRALLTLRRAHQ